MEKTIITLKNGYKFNFIYSSGSLGLNGSGWLWEKPLVKLGILPTDNIPIVTKTLTLKKNKGNSYSVKFIKGHNAEGVINNVRLHNPGIISWLIKYYPKTKNKDIIVSISGDTIEEYQDMIYILDKLDIKGIELNVSCPNRNKIIKAEEIIKLCNEIEIKHPIILKLGNKNDYFHLLVLDKLPKDKIDAISINSYKILDTTFSGQIIQDNNWYIASMLKASGIPVIFPSIWEIDDIYELIGRGADAISFGSVVLRHPFRVRNIMKEYIKREDNI